ncbi:MAG: PadR family transcriptional regulator [Chloroflexi bacterium]|nr:PadR family transcriptional regulator [Chloroflexota bacterium]
MPIPLEVAILDTCVRLRAQGRDECHGFLIAREIKESRADRLLAAYGTLYKALDRMERSGWLLSRWEDPMVAAREGRPLCRLYRVTVQGEQVLATAEAAGRPRGRKLEPGGAAP